ncbi:MAG: extracellular solute-binding protein, partial [Bifidobacterium aquikefiri]|uniref:extracellular solute-binding protein n=1 Tax=Bifidobacterium aquikefiri TaxID=1653207 RepID=UPI0039E812A7
PASHLHPTSPPTPNSEKPKYITTSIAIAAALVMALSGCGSGGSASSADTKAQGPIKVWFSNNEQELAWGKTVVAAWNSKHPDQKVTAQEILSASSSEEAITAAITAGTSPCLVYNISSSSVPGWVRQGGLVDLSKISDGNSYIETRSGDASNSYKTNGDYYQLPWKSNPVMIIYNKAIFKKAGINPENPGMNTYKGFLAAAKKIVSSGASKSAIWPAPTNEFYQPWNDFYPLYLAETSGTPLIKDEKATFDSEAGRDVTQFWKSIYEDGLAPTEKAADDAMAQGTTAMQLAGPWAIASYKGKVDVGVMPVPTSTGKKSVYTFADSKNISMFTSCKAQGTAWNFLKFSTSEAQDAKFIEATGQIPMRKNATSNYASFVAKNPSYAPYVDQSARTGDVPSITNASEVWQKFRDLWSADVIFGKGSASTFVSDSATAVNSLVKKG